MPTTFELDCRCGGKVRVDFASPEVRSRCQACGCEYEVSADPGELAGPEQLHEAAGMQCICGAALHLPAGELPDSITCQACGVSLAVLVEGAAAPFSPEGYLESIGDTRPTADHPELADPAQRCPSCGGQGEIAYCGPEGRDRVLVCSYCDGRVDMAEARGITRETRTERPNETIIERTTRWRGMAPDDDHLHEIRDRVDVSNAITETTIDLGEEHFDTPEQLRARLEELLPADMVEAVHADMTRVLRLSGQKAPTSQPTDRPARKGFIGFLRRLFGG